MVPKLLSIVGLSLLLKGCQCQYFRANGTNILDPNGDPFFAKGLVLSGWLNVEAYVLRLNDVHDRFLDGQTSIEKNIERLLGNTWDADLFWKTFRDNYVTAADVADFAEIGFNALRLPFNYRLISPTSGVFNENGFALMDRVIAWCKEQDLGLILDMHAAPGGQSHIQYADPEYTYWYEDEDGVYRERGVGVLWEDNSEFRELTGRGPEFNKRRMAAVWREIARRYQNETSIMAYEIMNQPYFYESSGVTTQNMRDVFVSVTSAIREVDINHIIIAEGNNFAEDIDGLLPPWDSNMVVAFHRYWRSADFEDGMLQTYLDARETYQVPILMSESGENSNTWIHKLATLLDEQKVGHFFWGWKKVDSISAANAVAITPDYQYVIENWRDVNADDISSSRILSGLLEMAEGMKTENCRELPGFFAALFDPNFGTLSQPYSDQQKIPGLIQAVHYDIGIEGIAHSDTNYESLDDGKGGHTPYNNGWIYRNDGVDIRKNTDDLNELLSIGYHVTDNEAGEWLKYTVDVTKEDTYSLLLHTFSATGVLGKVRLSSNGEDLAGDIYIPDGGGWITYVAGSSFTLPVGVHVLQLSILEGGFDIAWMDFIETSGVPASVARGENLIQSASASKSAMGAALVCFLCSMLL